MQNAVSSEFRVGNSALQPGHAQARPTKAKLPRWHDVRNKRLQTLTLPITLTELLLETT
jgi:hypothetical protein